MVDKAHLDIIVQGVDAWNHWRGDNHSIEPDLSGADLSGMKLYWADLSGADLSDTDLSATLLAGANLSGADLSGADLSGAHLSGANNSRMDYTGADLSWGSFGFGGFYSANLSGANLFGANLSWANLVGMNLFRMDLSATTLLGADLSGANLSGANLFGTDLSEAILSDANLSGANLAGADLTSSILVKTNLENATLAGCRIYGISAWSLKLEGADQENLNVSDHGEPAIMVDNLEVAQFIYLLLNNERIRQVIDTITSKVVLILGRFTPERKIVLDAIHDALRRHDYLPVLFDFDKPSSRDLTETISVLAHLARFIIADLTEAKSIPQELQAIVPHLPSVPVQPMLLASEYEYGMFEHLIRYPWVLEAYRYEDSHEVLSALEAEIIAPAETKATELSP